MAGNVRSRSLPWRKRSVRHVSLLFAVWTEPMSQVRSTATGAFVTRPRATVLPLI
jgi:hypothetical protein